MDSKVPDYIMVWSIADRISKELWQYTPERKPMDTNVVLQVLAVLIEIIVALAGIRLATKGKKFYGWWIALTFALYVVFDLSRLNLLPKNEVVISPLFLIASISILYAVWLIGCEVIPSRRYDL